MAILKSETIPNITAYADAVQAGFNGTYEAWCTILGSMSGDASAVSIQKVHYTLRANGWTDHIYSFENIYSHDEYLFLFVDKDGDNMTDDDLVWWYAADMMGSTQNRIIAHGDVPETDLPVILTIIKQVTLGGGGDINLQDKYEYPSTTPVVVMADNGFDGLRSVTIQPPRLQSKTVTPTTEIQIITPDSGYMGFSQVTVNASGSNTNIEQVWENPTPSATFASQVLSPLDLLVGYDYAIVETLFQKTSTISMTKKTIVNFKPSSGSYSDYIIAISTGTPCYRGVTLYQDGHISFDSAHRYVPSTTQWETNNDYAIPYRIYGAKNM